MKQPQLTTPSDISLHEPLRRTLPNGVTIHTLCAAEFEVVRVSFVFRAGSAQQRKAFVATSTANLLSEGTRDMTSQQIAEQFDFYGSYFDVNVDRDYVYISFCSLSKYFRQTLAVAEQILLHPLFPEEEVASYREKRKQRLRIERMKVETEAREAFARALFGPAHPYGITWPETAYDDLTRDDLLDFYARHYTARNCFVVCSGAADAAVVDAVAEVAGQLPAGADRAAEPFPPAVTTPHVAVPHAGAVQSSIRIGRLLFGRNHPDYVGMQVVAMLLGGYFGSRLMQNLREANGFTYGVVAAMVNLEREGYLAVATQVARDATDRALAEIYREIERLRTEPVAEEELSLVRNMMTGEMMRILDGPFGIADVTIENILMATLAAADDDAKAEAEHPVLKMQIQGICPYGWHIANLQDWKDLIWAAAQASKGSRYEIAESSASYKAIGGGSIANLSTILFDASWNTYSSGSPISPLAPDFGFNMFIQGWRLYDTGYNYGATSGDPRFYAWIPLLGQYTSKKTSFWRIYISGHTKTDMTLNDGFDLGNGSGAAIRCVKNYK